MFGTDLFVAPSDTVLCLGKNCKQRFPYNDNDSASVGDEIHGSVPLKVLKSNIHVRVIPRVSSCCQKIFKCATFPLPSPI